MILRYGKFQNETSVSVCSPITSTLPSAPSREGIGSKASGTGGGSRHRSGGAGDGEGSSRHPEPIQTLSEEKEVEGLTKTKSN